jgi:hypothetical protein
MVDNEPHAVVRLLLARMESHPEEFKVGDGPFLDRWYDSINTINAYGNETDRAALNAKLRDLRLGEAHEQVMDELVNGPERRRKEVEEREYEQQMLARGRLAQQQQMAAQQAVQQQQLQGYRNAVGQLGAYDYDRDMYRNAQALGLAGHSPSDIWTDESAGTLTTQPTLSTSTINAIKKALKL